jgi:hypothetical protein
MSMITVKAMPLMRQKISVQGRYCTDGYWKGTGCRELGDVVVSPKRLHLLLFLLCAHLEELFLIIFCALELNFTLISLFYMSM